MSDKFEQLTQLGQASGAPSSPDDAVLEAVPNPHRDSDYLIRFTCPEFTTVCPVTGQPDFAHLVIDYVPDETIVESKSLKLFLASFRNHGAFHEDCTVNVGKRLVEADRAQVAAHRRILVSEGRDPHRRFLADRRIAAGRVAAGSGRAAVSRAQADGARLAACGATCKPQTRLAG